MLYFKGMWNSIDFYRIIFWHVIPARIIVPCWIDYTLLSFCKGKIISCKNACVKPRLLVALSKLGNQVTLDNETFSPLKKYTCCLYGTNSKNMNKLRFQKFTQKFWCYFFDKFWYIQNFSIYTLSHEKTPHLSLIFSHLDSFPTFVVLAIFPSKSDI